jgi:hypothetical protein
MDPPVEKKTHNMRAYELLYLLYVAAFDPSSP